MRYWQQAMPPSEQNPRTEGIEHNKHANQTMMSDHFRPATKTSDLAITRKMNSDLFWPATKTSELAMARMKTNHFWAAPLTLCAAKAECLYADLSWSWCATRPRN